MSDRNVQSSRQINAKLAGFTFLFYMLVGAIAVFLVDRATHAEGTAAILARISEHELDIRIAIFLELLECFSALVLGLTLYAITREENHNLAMMGLVCRVAEGVLGAVGIPKTMELLWLASPGAGPGAPDAATANLLGSLLLMPVQGAMIGAPFFAVGSAIFSWLLLRGRMVPVPLAWLGVLASVLLVLGVSLQLADFLKGALTGYIWLPMVAFQIPLGLWLLIKGVSKPWQVVSS